VLSLGEAERIYKALIGDHDGMVAPEGGYDRRTAAVPSIAPAT